MSAISISRRSDAMINFVLPFLTRMVEDTHFRLPGDIGNNTRLLVIDSGDLTEILFFSPIIQYLKERFPGMRVTLLVREGNSELVRTMSQISEMISYEPAHLTLSSTTYFVLLRRIKSREFTAAILLGREFSFVRSLIALMTRAKIRVGFAHEYTYPFINCELRAGKKFSYEAVRAETLLSALGFHRREALPSWRLPEQDIKWAKQMIHFHKPQKHIKLVAVDPGLGKGNYRLVDDSFIFLVNHLARRMPCRLLVHSNNLDKRRLDKFRSAVKADLLDLEPKNVKEGLALLSCADLLLSSNTDYFHFAVSMRIPSVGLFTRHDKANWYPKGIPWVQILQGVRGQRVSLEEFDSKIDTLLHFASVE